MYLKVRVSLVLALLALFALVASSGASGVQATPQATNSVIKKVISPAEQNQALANAAGPGQPFPIPVDFGSSAVFPAAAGAPLGPPGRSAAGAAARGAESIARKAYPDAWADTDADDMETADVGIEGLSQEYSSYVYNQINALKKPYPHRWVGRVTFTTAGGTSFCSGTSISGNVLLTAAHCIYDSTNNVFYSGWTFRPATGRATRPTGHSPRRPAGCCLTGST